MEKSNVGIESAPRESVVNHLKKLLVGSYTLYLQSHNFHWNVSGLQFRGLHRMFEEHYTELDEIAERIRTLNFFAPGSHLALSNLSTLKKVQGVPWVNQMLGILQYSHETVVQTCHAALKQAQGAEDRHVH